MAGIGDKMALMMLLFAVLEGCNVFVTSSSAEKVDRAKALVQKVVWSIDEEGWPKTLRNLLTFVDYCNDYTPRFCILKFSVQLF
jgi:D-arabinose 1-dehydrogenase-like Zn-dependent alcohol dehydrogenase